MMVQEEGLSLNIDTFFYIFLVIFAIAIAYLLFINLFAFEPLINLQRDVRAAIELSENILSSPLTTSKNVFSSAELNRYDNTIQEPYVRHCRYGYSVTIESGTRRWEFGYVPKDFSRYFDFLKEYSFTIPVSVDGRPAKMTLRTYENTLTDVSCLIERAYTLKRVEKTPCKIPKRSSPLVSPEADSPTLPPEIEAIRCDLKFEKSDDDSFCLGAAIEDAPLVECRYLPGINVQKFLFGGQRTDEILDMTLVAYPLTRTVGTCSEITPDIIAGENDGVATIMLCLEEATES